jgi:predicted NAD-dependent protein-ADP-ribosyltransferase YbiA (DUF1768 family)
MSAAHAALAGAPSPSLRVRLGRLVLLLSSDKPGEVSAAAAAIGRTLEAAGLDWHAFAAIVAGPANDVAFDDDAELIEALLRAADAGLLSDAQGRFVAGCRKCWVLHGSLSEKQRAALLDMRDIADERRRSSSRFGSGRC